MRPQQGIEYERLAGCLPGKIKILVAFFVLVSIWILSVGTAVPESSLIALGVTSGFLIVLITFLNTDLALIIVIFSMLLSPEIPIAKLPARAVVIRIDDILIVFMFFAWLAKAAFIKELGFFRKTPINRPLAMYVLLYVVITAFAIFLGISGAKFSKAFFFLLKYIEYLMLFFLVANNLKSLRQCKVFTAFLLLTCVIVCIYGYVQMAEGSYWRVSAPFEGEKAEPNTLAGYLIVLIGLTSGFFLHSRSSGPRFLFGGLFLFIFPIFLFTLSRGGYLGFLVMFLSLIFFSKRKKVFLIYLLLILILLLPFILPAEVSTRIKNTFTGKTTYEVLGTKLALDESAAGRVVVWRYLGDVFSKSPLFGYGVAGIKFVDTQYGLILGETGILGIGVFFFLIYRLLKNSLRIYQESQDEYIQGLSLGFLTALIALLVMAVGANIFIIVRIMEPFWFIAAMVLVSPQLIKKNEEGILGT